MSPRATLQCLGLAACLAAGCDRDFGSLPPCDPEIPSPAAVRSDPEFAGLEYHKQSQYDILKGAGYDMWGDSRFEYSAALQFSLVPKKNARNEDELCVNAIALRYTLPPTPDRARMLSAFVRKASAGSSADPAELERQITHALRTGDKFHAISTHGSLTVSAGAVAHPSRGDFFVVSFDWPKP